MTDKTPEEQAVIDAAELYSDWSAIKTSGLSWEQALKNILKACEALRASRAPKGVKPETVEPGTRFKIAGQEDLAYTAVVCDMLRGPRGFRWDHFPNEFIAFPPDTRIIPIQEEEGGECQHACHLEGNSLGRAYCPKCGVGLTEPVECEHE